MLTMYDEVRLSEQNAKKLEIKNQKITPNTNFRALLWKILHQRNQNENQGGNYLELSDNDNIEHQNLGNIVKIEKKNVTLNIRIQEWLESDWPGQNINNRLKPKESKEENNKSRQSFYFFNLPIFYLEMLESQE